jgi:DNA-binding NtrC family response regulator
MPHKPKTVLVVDPDEAVRESIGTLLKAEYRILRASSGETALGMLDREQADIVLVEVSLPGISGLEVLRIAKANFELTEVIMMSSVNEVEAAVQAIKEGAYHFFIKDMAPDAVRSLLRNASEHQDLNRRVLTLSAQVAESEREFIVGPSKVTREIIDLARKVAKLPATVLILGESGTGKELLARLIHRESVAPEAPFIAVNLAAIPRELVESTLFGHERGAFTGAVRQQLGKFELAGNGTLFLDEIGDLRLELQAKLLRALQEGEIERVGGAKAIKTEFRLIAATNIDVEKAVKEGRFREDLYYRIRVVPIKLPPLRERIEDLPALADFFVRRHSLRFRKPVQGITASTLKALSAYWWPGNIRELENLVERLVAVSDKEWITDDDLPFEYIATQAEPEKEGGSSSLLQEATDTFERNFILKSLEKCGWNVTATARHLGIPLSTMKHKMGRLEIRPMVKRWRGA